MHILLVGLNSTYNLGDPLLLNCTKREIEKNLSNVQVEIANITGNFSLKEYQVPSLASLQKQEKKNRLVRLLSRRTPYDRVYISAQKDLQWELENGLKDVLGNIRHDKTDLVLFAGGQMFMHSFILPMQQIVKKCETEHVPVIFHSCGFGPIGSRHLRQIFEDTLASPCVSSISVRDYPPKNEFNRLPEKLRQKIHFSADMGLWASDVYSVSHDRKSDEAGATHAIGLGPVYTDSVSIQNEVRFFTELIRLLDQNQIAWKLFTNGHPADERIARLILQNVTSPALSEHPDFAQVRIPKTPQQLAKTVTSFDGIISCRLHSHIIAASFNIPSVAIVWDRKLRQFFRRAGVPDRCFAFRDGPEGILSALKAAKQTGWDQKLIMEMREESLSILLKQIQSI